MQDCYVVLIKEIMSLETNDESIEIMSKYSQKGHGSKHILKHYERTGWKDVF